MPDSNDSLTQPLVTIGIPVYNGAAMLRRALDSVLAQDYENVEIIVSDNGSTDGSAEIALEYASRTPRMRVVVHESNIGASDNFRFLLAQAKGKYFFWAAYDDQWDPTFTRKLVDGLEKRPEAGVALCAVRRISDDDTPRDLLRFNGPLDPSRLSHFRVAWNCARGITYHLGVYGVWRTEYFRKVFHGYPLFLAADRVFMCAVALSTRYVYVDEFLYIRTAHRSSIAERYSTEAIGETYGDPLRYVKAMARVTPFLLRSPAIPLRRKPLVILIGARFSVLMCRWAFVDIASDAARRLLPPRIHRAMRARVRRLLNI